MNLTAIIPVRENPDGRLPQKCLLPFRDGLNLTEWKLRQVLQVLPAEDIYLSTSSLALKECAHRFGVRIHDRDEYLSTDIPTWPDVVAGLVREIGGEHIALIHVTNPLTAPEDYRRAFAAYEKHVVAGRRDSLIMVNRLQEFFWNEYTPVNYRADKGHRFSQAIAPLFRVTCALYMAPRERMLAWHYPIGPYPYKFEVSKRAGIDIDNPEDYSIALALCDLRP